MWCISICSHFCQGGRNCPQRAVQLFFFCAFQRISAWSSIKYGSGNNYGVSQKELFLSLQDSVAWLETWGERLDRLCQNILMPKQLSVFRNPWKWFFQASCFGWTQALSLQKVTPTGEESLKSNEKKWKQIEAFLKPW